MCAASTFSMKLRPRPGRKPDDEEEDDGEQVLFCSSERRHAIQFIDVKPAYFKGYLSKLNPIYKGRILSYKECKEDQLYRRPFYSKVESDTLLQETKRYFMFNDDDMRKVRDIMNTLGRQGCLTEPNGDCLFSAILQQIAHHPELYTPNHLRRQVALHLLKYPDLFYQYIEQELFDSGESYESYVVNLYNGNIWGDDLIASAVSHMFNLSISIIVPTQKKPIHLFHDQKRNPDIVVIGNGGSYLSEANHCTHFSMTRSKNARAKLPGFHNKLDDVKVYEGFDLGRQTALARFVLQEKEKALDYLRLVNRNLKKLDSKIEVLTKEATKLRLARGRISEQMKELGIDVEQLALEEARDEAEKQAEKERKAAETLLEVQRAAYPQVDDTVTGATGGEQPGTSTGGVTRQGSKTSTDDTSVEVMEVDDDEPEVIDISTPEGMEKVLHLDPTPPGFVIPEKMAEFLDPKFFKYLVPAKVPDTLPGQVAAGQVAAGQVAAGQVTAGQVAAGQVATGQVATGQVVTTAQVATTTTTTVTPSSSTIIRSRSVRGVIPEDQRVAGRFYCDKCPHNYSSIYDLNKHKKNNCGQTEKKYKCAEETCDLRFYMKRSAYEHHCRVHLGIMPYKCDKCGMEFAYFSKKSDHKKVCPQR